MPPVVMAFLAAIRASVHARAELEAEILAVPTKKRFPTEAVDVAADDGYALGVTSVLLSLLLTYR